MPRAKWMGKTKQSKKKKSSTKESLAMVLKELSRCLDCICVHNHMGRKKWDIRFHSGMYKFWMRSMRSRLGSCCLREMQLRRATRAVWGSDEWNVSLFIRCAPVQAPSSVLSPLPYFIFLFFPSSVHIQMMSIHTACFFSEAKCSHLLGMFKTLLCI